MQGLDLGVGLWWLLREQLRLLIDAEGNLDLLQYLVALLLELVVVLAKALDALKLVLGLLQAHLDGAGGVPAVMYAHIHEDLVLVQL